MTRRKPLEWYSVGDGEIPACDRCFDYMRTPFLVEACASVGIEHGKSTDQMMRETIEAFHASGHRKGEQP